MSAGSFQQDSLGWRIDLITRRIGEWIEYRVTRLNLDTDWDLDLVPLKLLWQAIEFCLWSIIVILLFWMVWQIWLQLRPYWKRWQRTPTRQPFALPVRTHQLSATDWVERSQTARIDGNYREAIFSLYRAMLSLLDERGIIATQLNLTDEEYRQSLIKMQLSALQSYESLLSIHQRLCFSKAEADRSLFEQCQQAYKQIAN